MSMSKRETIMIRCTRIELALNKKGLTEYDDSTIEFLDEIRQEAREGYLPGKSTESCLADYEKQLSLI